MKQPITHVAVIGYWRDGLTLARCGLWLADEHFQPTPGHTRWCRNCNPTRRKRK